MKKKTLSIIIPVYNEESTVEALLSQVISVELSWNKEIIVVNDGSTDQTEQKIKPFFKKIIYIKQENQGKGGAVRTGLEKATGDYVIIQDADLEYDPIQIPKLLAVADRYPNCAVFGSRISSPPVLFGKKRTILLLHYFANRLFSLITSLLYGIWITDMETGYKLFPVAAISKMNLKAQGFELEPEITAKLVKNGYKIKEVAITTNPRGFEHGKKFNTIRDGSRALLGIFKYRFTN